MRSEGAMRPSGDIGLTVFRGNGSIEHPDPRPLLAVAPEPAGGLSVREMIHHGCPRPDLTPEVNRWRRANFANLLRGAGRVLAARRLNVAHMYGAVWLTVHRGDGRVEDLGLASLRVVTTAGVNYLVDALQNLTEPENLKYHGFGTGTTAEASSDTALVTELTTEYATDNTRPTGTLTEGATANVFRTVATLAPDGAGDLAITEHGIFSQAATGGGTLWDRSKFAAVTLARGIDSLQVTYDATFAAGG